MSSVDQTAIKYKDWGVDACHLWRAGYQKLVDQDGVVDLRGEVTFLRYETEDGIWQAVFGSAGITIGHALLSLGLPHVQWVRVGSMIVRFRECDTKAVHDYLSENLGERGKWWALNATRSSVAAAICGYRRRRDAMLVKAKGGAA